MALTELYVSDAGGGAHDGSDPANAFSFTEMITDINAGGKAGNRYNLIKGAGDISRTTTTDTISGGGSSTSPVIIRGYASVITDGYQGRTAGGGLITTNMPVVTFTSGRWSVTGTWIIIESIVFQAATSNPCVALATDSCMVRCVVDNSSTNSSATAVTITSRGVVFDNDLSLSGASGGLAACNIGAGVAVRVVANRINGGPAAGVTASTGSPIVAFNTIYASGGNHVQQTGAAGVMTAMFNTLVGGSANGVDVASGVTGMQCVIGNMVTDNGGYGFDLNNDAVAAFSACNRTRDNTSGATNLGTDWISATSFGEVTTDTGGASTDYVDSGSNDYRLIASSPATSAAQPASASMGALQRDQTATGGSGGSYTFVG